EQRGVIAHGAALLLRTSSQRLKGLAIITEVLQLLGQRVQRPCFILGAGETRSQAAQDIVNVISFRSLAAQRGAQIDERTRLRRYSQSPLEVFLRPCGVPTVEASNGKVVPPAGVLSGSCQRALIVHDGIGQQVVVVVQPPHLPQNQAVAIGQVGRFGRQRRDL